MNIYEQYGIIFKQGPGDERIGDCPFCGKIGHFYVNSQSLYFDCKKCEAEGNKLDFLRLFLDLSKQSFTGKIASDLMLNRGIKISTFKDANIGYNWLTNHYIIPVFNSQKQPISAKLYNLQQKKYVSTSGCELSLFGLEYLSLVEDIKTIYLCEGEWDTLAMREALKRLEIKNEIAIGVPGAGTFREVWSQIFSDKKVYLLYDNDKAGFEGLAKAKKFIGGRCDCRSINWPNNTPDGYDIRDLYKDNKEDPHSFLHKVKSYCRLVIEGQTENESEEKPSDKKIERVPYEFVYEVYSKWLQLPDMRALDVLFGSVIANRIQGDPVWMFLVAPSGGTKSELLLSLFNANKILTTTTLTPPSLISGVNLQTGDPSLIPRLNGKVLIIKDFTTILAMNQNARDEIFGIFRDAYDGKIEKQFANGIIRSYNSKFGFLAGVTPAIEQVADGYQSFGERFLRWYVELPEDTTSIITKALMNVNHENEMKNELNAIGKMVLEFPFENLQLPEVPKDILEKIAQLAQFVSLMRGTVVRDRFSKEVTHKPITELGTRLAKQFLKLLFGVGMFRGKAVVGEDEYEIIKKTAISTCPVRMIDLFHVIRKKCNEFFMVEELANHTNFPNITISRILENMVMLDLVRKRKEGLFKTDYYISPVFNNLIKKSEVFYERNN